MKSEVDEAALAELLGSMSPAERRAFAAARDRAHPKMTLDKHTYRGLRPRKKKLPVTKADSDQLRNAEMKRRRKGQMRLAQLPTIRGRGDE